MEKLLIHGYLGLGDNIYQRPFVIEAINQYKHVYLITPWPDLFRDLPRLSFVKPDTRLKTQLSNIQLYPGDFWAVPVKPYVEKRFNYHDGRRKGLNILESFEKVASPSKLDFSMPIQPEWIYKAQKILKNIKTRKKLCIIQHPTIKTEWVNSSRLPKPEYIQLLIDKYKDEYFYISVADAFDKEKEYLVGDLQNIDLKYNNGELDIYTVLGLIALADMTIGFPSFILPYSLAVKANFFCLFGGGVKPELLTDPRMDMSNLEYAAPDPFCNCLELTHECNKDMPEEFILDTFDKLKNRKNKYSFNKFRKATYQGKEDDSVLVSNLISKTIKKRLLIMRLRARRCNEIANNQFIKDNFEVFCLDDTWHIKEYHEYQNQSNFAGYFTTPSLSHTDKEIYSKFITLLEDLEITHCIIAQKLFRSAELMKAACKELGIKTIWAEAFFDDKLIYDYTGLQYDCPNDIYKFVNTIPLGNSQITLPSRTRENQPQTISKKELFSKYNLSPKGQYIVIFGQLLWDMSVIKSVNVNIDSYKKYLQLLLENNKNTTFLFKNHPLYKGRTDKTIQEFMQYQNLKIIDESLETLFNNFEYFSSFSSTTILEGIIRDKKFATLGFHFCNNDKLVIQLRSNVKARNLYSHLEEFTIDPDVKRQYLYFICNYYTLSFDSPKLYQKLIMDPEEYYKQKY